MQCPKCLHSQNEAAECERCGLIFAKYQESQARKEKESTAAAAPSSASLDTSTPHSPPPNKGIGLLGITIGLVLGLCLAGLYFLRTGQGKINSFPDQSARETAVSEESTDQAAEQDHPVAVSSHPPLVQHSELIGLAKQLAERFPPGNAVEAARNAAVIVKTPWGLGSGFFITRQGHVLTNRHVVEFEAEMLKKLKMDLEQLSHDLAREKEYITSLKKQKMATRGQETIQQLTETIAATENEYSRYAKIHEELQQRLNAIMRFSPLTDVELTLIDGTKIQVQAIHTSKTHDLALITTNALEAPFISTADSTHMQQGKRLFTIGNPAGLTYTVTSGIFSGYRDYQGTQMIQTDAPINPGNSGGPLLDEEGRVLGINTMILRNTQGIGFAIPFPIALEQFRHLLGM